MKIKSLFLTGLLVMSMGMVVMLFQTGQASASKVYTTNPSVRGSWAGHWKDDAGTYYEKLKITKYNVKSKVYYDGKLQTKFNISSKQKGDNKLFVFWTGKKVHPYNYWCLTQKDYYQQVYCRRVARKAKPSLKVFHMMGKGYGGSASYYYHHKF